jgi:hypothetical protein
MKMLQPSFNNLDLKIVEDLEKASQRPQAALFAKTENATQDTTGAQTQRTGSSKRASGTEFLKERTKAALQRTQSQIEQRVLQAVLPLWTDENRGIPNPFVRSGLFTVGNSEKREYVVDMVIASLSNYEIKFTGAELHQEDLSVWMSLINLAREKPMSEAIYFTGYQIIKDLGWRMHSETYKRVQSSIERLKVTGLKITTKGNESAYSGSLIRDYAWTERDDSGNTKWMVRFEPRISALFLEDTTTLLNMEIRRRLGTRSTLALWLHAFYATHRDPVPNSLEKIHELCRSKDTLSSFRRNIGNALEKLVKVEFLKSYSLDNDILRVEKCNKPLLAYAK